MTENNMYSYSYFVQVFFIYVSLCILCIQSQDPIVETTSGSVRGVIADDGDYSMFLGIPFAQVNENNPFGSALPQPRFDGIFEANDDSARCPQEEEFNHTIVGSLDCLHLNVHVPSSASPTNLLPVFVWIFGGGFNLGFFGRFLYGPKFLMQHDIVFVSINYRLGPYGFMCLDTPEVPGNQGLKDQLMALRWIRENIAAFGGNPDMITLAGNSAGSLSVDHQIMRKNDGPQLFHKCILQSGTTMSPIIPNSEYSQDSPLVMAEHLGFQTTDISEALAFLAQVDPLEIVKTTLELNLSFGPTVEKEFEGVEAFVTKDTYTVCDVPGVRNMPLMIGFNDDEALLVGVTADNLGQEAVFPLLATLFDPTHPDFGFIVKTVQNFYFGNAVANDDQFQPLIDFNGDYMFIYPMFRSVERFLDNDAGNMYLYMFSYAGERNFVKHKDNVTVGGAAHADELGYLFDISYMDEPSLEDQRVVDVMTAMWANFITYADPTPQTSQLLPLKWEPISKDFYHYMNIDLELRVGTRPIQERMTFWDLLYEGYGHIVQRATVDRRSEAYQTIKKIKL